MLTSHTAIHSTLARTRSRHHHGPFRWDEIPPTPRAEDLLARMSLLAFPEDEPTPAEYLQTLSLEPVAAIGTAALSGRAVM